MPVAPALLACLLLAAAPALEAQRAQAEAARQAVAQLEAEQQARREELAALGRRIETLKGSSRGRLLPGGELDEALKRSQELSAVLTGLARQLQAGQAGLEGARLQLVDGLGAELARLQADFDRQQGREARAAVVARLRALRAEREAVRAALPPARLPTVQALKASDDPVELLAQADQLRDGEERAHRERLALEARLGERRREAELDRRVQRFLGEESMFDEQDRRLRVERVGAAGQRSLEAGGLGGSPLGATTASGTPTGTGPGTDFSSAPPATGTDARPQVGRGTSLGSDDDDLAALERQREALERLEQDLGRRAAELQRRAAELR